jgi:hypothetical protein
MSAVCVKVSFIVFLTHALILLRSLSPTTTIFYRAQERARIHTAQACDKCRVRKAKVTSQPQLHSDTSPTTSRLTCSKSQQCSGDHPVCERCRSYHYAPERPQRQCWIGAT